MCGRYSFDGGSGDERVKRIIALMDRDHPGGYKTGEIVPGDTAAAVISEGGRLRPVPAVFGFPGFGNSRLLINARSETAADKPTFAEAFRSRRVILPADGFYEWSRDKTKYLFTLTDASPVYLCGLYTLTNGVYRFVILTRRANGSMIGVHDRMPVIAAEREVRPYLTDPRAAAGILGADGPRLIAEPVA